MPPVRPETSIACRRPAYPAHPLASLVPDPALGNPDASHRARIHHPFNARGSSPLGLCFAYLPHWSGTTHPDPSPTAGNRRLHGTKLRNPITPLQDDRASLRSPYHSFGFRFPKPLRISNQNANPVSALAQHSRYVPADESRSASHKTGFTSVPRTLYRRTAERLVERCIRPFRNPPKASSGKLFRYK